MPKIKYIEKKFKPASLRIIEECNEIVEAYKAQGFELTLRQLYYQRVARGLSENNDRAYQNLSVLLNDARYSGLMDWHAIVDRTRNLRGLSHWTDPASIIDSAAYSFRIDKWREQPNYVEVYVEKDALVGVVGSACEPLDVNYFSCRGYTSATELWDAAQRCARKVRDGKDVTIIHLGDHDPSGIDMSRDIEERIRLFMSSATSKGRAHFNLKRIALNFDQIEAYSPPPNPAKTTDSRFEDYRANYGDESWELDALEPSVIKELISEEIMELRDEDLWTEAEERESEARKHLTLCSNHWDDVTAYLDENYGDK